MFEVVFYDERTRDGLDSLPPKLYAKMLRLLDVLSLYGHQIDRRFSTAFGDGLFELRAKAEEGIARAFYTFEEDKIIVVLHIFIKKDQKTPKNELELARKILKELKCEKWYLLQKSKTKH